MKTKKNTKIMITKNKITNIKTIQIPTITLKIQKQKTPTKKTVPPSQTIKIIIILTLT